MSSAIYLEGGGDSRDLQSRCQMGFRKLLERCGYMGRMPKLVACGGRSAAFDDFKIASASAQKGDFVALWIDSEDPVADLEATWAHLKARTDDNWDRPNGATNEQVLFMTTCMETWIVADRATLAKHYGAKLQKSALPALHNLEGRPRDVIQNALIHATRNCSNGYRKGKRSFEVLGKLDPATLNKYLPSFVRVRRILDASL
ncbi:MAG TPA: DUF4276 family protein [Gemmataceae bacterium]|nr:DUF4276 family protein [Gemmataceae bacterium]